MLSGHGVQVESPRRENVPDEHCVSVPFRVQLYPAGHFKQDVEPTALKVPDAQD